MTGYFQLTGQRKEIAYGTLRQTFGLLHKSAPIVAVTGAGGKTTLIELLAEEYAGAGSRVLVTTTTHMLCPQNAPVLFMDEWKQAKTAETTENTMAANHSETINTIENRIKYLRAQIDRMPSGVLYIAEHAPDFSQSKKLAPLSDTFQKALFQCGYPVLIEADGSKGLPCKVPASHEPVIPKETTTVIGVLSARAVGRQIRECAHRAELVAELLHKPVEALIELSDLEKIAESERGLRKSVNDTMEFHAVLRRY